MLLPILTEWAFDDSAKNQRNSLETWVIELFTDLSIPHEALVTGLEDLFYNPEVPWNSDRIRAKVAQLLVYTINNWYEDTARGGGIIFGGDDNAVVMLDLLKAVVGWGSLDRRAQEEAERVKDVVDRALW